MRAVNRTGSQRRSGDHHAGRGALAAATCHREPGPSGTVTLSWDDVTDEIGYNVYWSTDVTKPAMPNKKVATETITFEVTTLDACTTYHFWVEGFNARAAGEAGQVTSKAETLPADPSALAIKVTGTTATVTWKDNADNEGDSRFTGPGTRATQPATGVSAFAKAGVGGTARTSSTALWPARPTRCGSRPKIVSERAAH